MKKTDANQGAVVQGTSQLVSNFDPIKGILCEYFVGSFFDAFLFFYELLYTFIHTLE